MTQGGLLVCMCALQDLLCLPAAAADVRASALGLRWSFPNNYALSKHLVSLRTPRPPGTCVQHMFLHLKGQPA
jgi:hypothetical protein